jgi:hypothetical protein
MPANRSDSREIPERRFFIKKTLLGAGALTFGSLLPLGCSRTTPSTGVTGMTEFFDDDEAYILLLIARRIITLDAADDGVVHDIIVRLDRYFTESYPEDQREFRRLLTVFNNPVFVFLFSGYFKSFDRMGDAQKDVYLREWMTSSWGFRRTAFQALKRLMMSMYYTHDKSWESIGFDGPLL